MALGFALAVSAHAQNTKDYLIQIQRDVALLQEALRQIDRGNGEKIVALEALVKQNIEATTRLNQAVAVIEREINKQSDQIVPSVTATAAKVDALTNQFAGLRDAVEETNSMLGRLMQEVSDVKTQLTTLPPPTYPGAPGEEDPNVSDSFGETFFTGAVNDYNRGNYELAKAQFMDFLRYSGDSARAPEAQYYLGAVAYDSGDFEDAVRQFDLVLEKYPVGVITADALYKKAMALMKLDRRAEAMVEFQAVVERFPSSSVAPNASDRLDELKSGGNKPSPLRQ
jgi:tol-pal system protein YbgF